MKHADLQRTLRLYAKSIFLGENNHYCVLSIGDVWSTFFTNQGELSAYCWSLLCSFGSIWVSWPSISSYWWLSTILHQFGLLTLWVSAPDDNCRVQVVFPCRIIMYIPTFPIFSCSYRELHLCHYLCHVHPAPPVWCGTTRVLLFL